uniref:Uncharacterized protein n=1 Tax=Rhipicephalus microplus TaxID=6941 RepID=A0A6G5AIC3_RHIMP
MAVDVDAVDCFQRQSLTVSTSFLLPCLPPEFCQFLARVKASIFTLHIYCTPCVMGLCIHCKTNVLISDHVRKMCETFSITHSYAQNMAQCSLAFKSRLCTEVTITNSCC